MDRIVIIAEETFDGATRTGPTAVLVENGVISAIEFLPRAANGKEYADPFGALPAARLNAAFLMPGLVEAHAHLFLDGGELNAARRSDFLKSDRDAMITIGRQNAIAATAAGVTLVRDAGDRFGINHHLRSVAASDLSLPAIRSPGRALRRPKRYGAFMATEVESDHSIRAFIADAATSADELKIILTDIIDFDAGDVIRPPQFDLDDMRLIIGEAKANGLKTFAHCSGMAGIDIAITAGVDAIEHGFFMTREALQVMADKGIAWTPTFSPVHFQQAHPMHAGWSAAAQAHLARILASHAEHVAIADQLGVPLMTGSDAGSFGVRHGRALIDELMFFVNAGLSMERALCAATATPRRQWGVAGGVLAVGAPAELVALAESPFADPMALNRVHWSMRCGRVRRQEATPCA